MLNSVTKLWTITLVLHCATFSLGLQYTQDDILAFPRYQVLLTNEKISNSQLNEKDIEVPTHHITMTSSSGQPFRCSIPNVQIEQERLEREKEERAKEETQEDIQNTISKGLDLLEPLGNHCMRFYASTHQYWVYEYCHNQYVRQFHIERSHDGKKEVEKETASFYLGIYPGSIVQEELDNNVKAVKQRPKKSDIKAPTLMRKVGDQRYLVQEWRNGSNCDLTSKPRTVEVQFHCEAQGHDRVSSFVEVSTCHYQIEVSTPRLCEEMNLSHKYHSESHKIECRPIVSDKLIEQAKEEEKEEEEVMTTEEKDIQQLLDSVVAKEAKDDDTLLDLISDLTEQITQLRNQINSNTPPKIKKTEFSLFTLDAQGNIIPGADLDQLISKKDTKPVLVKKQEAKDQQKNKQAYHQHYIE